MVQKSEKPQSDSARWETFLNGGFGFYGFTLQSKRQDGGDEVEYQGWWDLAGFPNKRLNNEVGGNRYKTNQLRPF